MNWITAVLLDDEDVEKKHLPGQHDQKRHAGQRGEEARGVPGRPKVSKRIIKDQFLVKGDRRTFGVYVDVLKKVWKKTMGPYTRTNDLADAFAGGIDILPDRAKIYIDINEAHQYPAVDVHGHVVDAKGGVLSQFQVSLGRVDHQLVAYLSPMSDREALTDKFYNTWKDHLLESLGNLGVVRVHTGYDIRTMRTFAENELRREILSSGIRPSKKMMMRIERMFHPLQFVSLIKTVKGKRYRYTVGDVIFPRGRHV